ncbi:peptide-methionine (S)-S-oxide reductase [Spirosomataceae bacterium TFI 002]|nr:peptide-methionine (S)-S-oxide reductase [Spirosomataceae bacterium TFI 002]
MKKLLIFCLLPLLMSFQLEECSSNNTQTTYVETPAEELQGLQKAYFASGCFWCVEAVFESVKGVKESVSGYSGGTESNPTYQQVGAGLTSHAEAVEVFYDPNVISYQTLVKVFYGSHNPTTVNGQAPDFGPQYRSMIYYQNDEEKAIATAFKDSLDASGAYKQPIATEIVKFKKFWKAEEYHQDYEKRNPNQSYVVNVSVPRLKRFQAKFPELLKENH